MHVFEFDNLLAAYRTWGDGHPVVLLHSGGSSSAQWERFAAAAPPDWWMIAPDLIGFGTTEPWPVAGALTHDLQGQLVGEIIAGTARGPVDIVGHSYGGAVAIRLAINLPQTVRSMVLIEPIVSCLLEEVSDPLFAESRLVAKAFIASVEMGTPEIGWEAFIDSRSGTGTWGRLSDARRQQFLVKSEQTKQAFLSNLNNRTTLAECANLNAPVTMVSGSDTTAPDRRTAEVLTDVLPKVKHVVIPGAGHMSPLTHATEVVSIVRSHLQGVT